MKEEFEKLVAAGKLDRQLVEPLALLTTSGYCMHRSWGFGKITTVDTVFGRFSIDFPGKPNHNMDLAFAAQSLKPIPKDHILAPWTRRDHLAGEILARLCSIGAKKKRRGW